MKKIKKIKIKSFKSVSGKLIPVSFDKKFPFSIKRIFFLYGIKKKIRGDHAHKKCSQFVFPVLGRIEVNYVTKKENKTILLNSKKNEGYLLKPKTWCKIKFLTQNAILLVACDMEYDFNDYIENFSDFLKIIKKK